MGGGHKGTGVSLDREDRVENRGEAVLNSATSHFS